MFMETPTWTSTPATPASKTRTAVAMSLSIRSSSCDSKSLGLPQPFFTEMFRPVMGIYSIVNKMVSLLWYLRPKFLNKNPAWEARSQNHPLTGASRRRHLAKPHAALDVWNLGLSCRISHLSEKLGKCQLPG